jgi:hypothetical protein
MDEPGFIAYMKKAKKSEDAAQAHIAGVKAFEAYLIQSGKTLETASPDDLRLFAAQVKIDVFGIFNYYEFSGNEAMWAEASIIWSEPNYAKFKIKEFLDVDPQAVELLKKHGIVTASQMVDAGKDPAARTALAQKTGLSEAVILELVKLSDQARIGGHKRIRARLFHEAGLDTLDKIAALEPETVRQILTEYIDRSGFPGIPSTPKEAAHSVVLARYLPRLVEY